MCEAAKHFKGAPFRTFIKSCLLGRLKF